MNLNDAKILAELLIEQHLGSDWHFAWSDSKTSFGMCKFRTNQIMLSSCLTKHVDEAHAEDTILHEIAHALTPGHNHDRVWKAAARKIGATPRATSIMPETIQDDPNWSWVMLLGSKVIRGYFRKPNKSTFEKIKRAYLPGRKQETLGKLKLVPYSSFKRMK